MSEQRRATLTPFGKSEKKLNKSPRKTFRFNFTLYDPTEDKCPRFDYGSEVKLEEKKLLKKHLEEKEKRPNGVVGPFGEEDNDDDVKRIARRFEEKYNEKKGKCKSYRELGLGYDETDPFIDNTEANDEELQEDQETVCGGYYINSGPLQLKRVDFPDPDDLVARRYKRAAVIEEEEESEAEAVEDDKQEIEKEEVKDDLEVKASSEEGPSERLNGFWRGQSLSNHRPGSSP